MGLFDAFLALLIALCFAECASQFSVTGGAYVYAKEAFGNFVGYEIGFVTWAIRMIAEATLYVGFALALGGMFPQFASPMAKNVIVTIVAVILMGLNIRGVKITAVVNNLFTLSKLVPLLSFGIVVAIYLAVMAVCIGVLGDQLGATTVPLQTVFAKITGPVGGKVIAIGTVVSIAGVCIASSFVTPRSGVALAENKMMPKALAKTNRYDAPYVSIVVSTVIALLIALLIAYSGTFETLAQISVVSLVLLSQAQLTNLIWGFGALVVAVPFYFLTESFRKCNN